MDKYILHDRVGTPKGLHCLFPFKAHSFRLPVVFGIYTLLKSMFPAKSVACFSSSFIFFSIHHSGALYHLGYTLFRWINFQLTLLFRSLKAISQYFIGVSLCFFSLSTWCSIYLLILLFLYVSISKWLFTFFEMFSVAIGMFSPCVIILKFFTFGRLSM